MGGGTALRIFLPFDGTIMWAKMNWMGWDTYTEGSEVLGHTGKNAKFTETEAG